MESASLRTKKSWLPFGLDRTKPRHYREMLRVAWENRDQARYAWRILKEGVCDGCALGVSGFRDWTIDGVHLCMTRLFLLRLNTMPAFDPSLLADVRELRQRSNEELRALGRIPVPLLRRAGEPGFRPVSWDEALELAAGALRKARPDRIAFYLTSRGLTNETYYVAQKLARLLGTNNIDNAARLCHAPSTAAMKRALGVAASTCSYRDWIGTDVILFFGSNPANDQPVATKYLLEAKRKGTRVVLVNPYLEPGMERYWIPSDFRSALFGTALVDEWFAVRTGGDLAFCSGVLRALLERGRYDEEFVREHTTGFEDVEAYLRGLDWSDLESEAGLPRSEMERCARILAEARSGVFVWSMGVTQHSFAADTVQAILNLALCLGFVGREFCGVVPIRGHSGVQGGAEMGAYATVFPGGVPISPENARAFTELYGFPVPERPGLTAPEMVEAAVRGELDVLYCVGGNFLRTLADPAFVARALSRLPVRIHQDLLLTEQVFLDPEEAVLLLPAKTRYEQDDGGTETTTERRVLFSPEIPRQLGEARAEWKILRDLAARVAPELEARFGCRTGWEIRREIARVAPQYDGIQHLAKAGDSFQWGGRLLCRGGRFPTPDGRARLRPVPLRREPAQSGTFRLSTRRGRQFNSMVYAPVDPLTGASRDAVFLSPDDAAELRLRSGDPVVLVSEHGRFRGRVHLAPLGRGNVQVHFPEGNVLLSPQARDPVSGVPDYNAVVRIERGNA
ncbi:MAG: formate dehydrogenase [Candidatus Binatia bacterium]|nr:MAG: formate dehydrogenase [Candidatus Binatia bacterium]